VIVSVYIGRFSPFHNGHAEVLNRARRKSDLVIVLVGSVNKAQNPKNPWSFDERADMINDYMKSNGAGCPVVIRGIRDFPYNDQRWIANVHNVINETLSGIKADKIELFITGADRDSSTFYLKFFPEFKLDLAEEDLEVSKHLNATSVREILFGLSFNGSSISAGQAELLLTSFLPRSTINFLSAYEKTAAFQEMKEEHVFNVGYKNQFKSMPYEPIFHTVDACVIQTGYVLLVRRRSRPGKGLWALPGGFLNANERLLTGAIRELKEETKLKVPEAVLKGSVKYNKNFDHPDRSLRGRTITTAFLFVLPDFVTDGKINLPEVKGSDDAEKAMWVPLDTALNSPSLFFEDHYDIIETFVGKL
jgi:bifunctional NMN adenylyltransferase/nudix hydrolase